MGKAHTGGDFDDFLSDEGLLDDAEAVATKRMVAFQISRGVDDPAIREAIIRAVDELIGP